jgi:hypothetical protein
MRAPKKPDGTPDRSKEDFGLARTYFTGGKSVEDTIARLMEVSDNAQQRAAIPAIPESRSRMERQRSHETTARVASALRFSRKTA